MDRNKVTYGELTRSELTGMKTSLQSLERSFIKGRNEMKAMVGGGQGTPSESSLYMPTPSSLPEESEQSLGKKKGLTFSDLSCGRTCHITGVHNREHG